MKACNKCGETKSLGDFYNLKTTKDGKQRSCKKCQNDATYKRRKDKSIEYADYQREYNKKYREDNRDSLKSYQQKYRSENEHKLRPKRVEWLKRNKDSLSEYHREYYRENKEELSEKRKLYYAENINIFKHHRRVRRDRLRGSEVTLTKEQESDIFRRFGSECALTGRKGNLHLDHFIPVAAGGSTSVGNMIPLDGELNISKHANNPFEWVKRRNDVPSDSFARVVSYLAELNGLTVDEYREFVFSCFKNKNKNIS
ncbi:HNH endonuclease [Bacillus sp. MCCB 382]|uniref:HNH endonuclease n=1 Tax=Bacillus sp. MCCB 382 TaxID=2860197 RepID=UPI001C5A191A|nr:HNH endonuclease [Bacillus sp. MCCB 382]